METYHKSTGSCSQFAINIRKMALLFIHYVQNSICVSSKLMAETSKFKRKFTMMCFRRLSFTQRAVRRVWYHILFMQPYHLNLISEFCSIIVSNHDTTWTWSAKQHLCSSRSNKEIDTFSGNAILSWYLLFNLLSIMLFSTH